jgi:hypothetical protein
VLRSERANLLRDLGFPHTAASGPLDAGIRGPSDVRSRATVWVDLSGYGDGAVYVSDPEAWLNAHPAR